MQPEPERISDDEVYERDCQAWNLPRPRPELAIASDPNDRADDRSGHGSHSIPEAERT